MSPYFLKKTLAFQRTFIKGFLKFITKNNLTQSYFNQKAQLLSQNVYFLCAKYCCKNMLDIVVDFPQSYQTILALKKCLDKTSLLSQLGQQLNRQIQKRLLIPGVITQNILNQYINMLKVLQIIDPQGTVFQKITGPIKNYLLKRTDTLRCIISHLTDDVQNYSKLTRQVVKIPSKQYIQQMSSQEDEKSNKQWQVIPSKQNKIKTRIKYQQIDLVTVLVGLYGSQQAFISQYQNMMAQKFMSIKQYNLDEQIRNIQLLKKRFGQSALQTCNIVIKDVKDSKKNNIAIHGKYTQLNLDMLNCLAVSRGYWPINYQNTSSFQLSPQLKQIFDQYAKRFAQLKAMRKINFHFNLGYVKLTLTFDNGPFSFKCLPIQAMMIQLFDQNKLKSKNNLTSQQLSNMLQIAQNLVKQKMSFWVHKGVVKQNRSNKIHSLKRINSFQDGQVISYTPVKIYENIIKDEIDDDVQTSMLKQSTSTQSHLRHIIQGLILSILNTNGPKPPQKIHLLLKTVYKTDLDYNYGQAQTIQILKKMLSKKKINFNGQLYSSKQ